MRYFTLLPVFALLLPSCKGNISPYTISTLDSPAVKAPVLETLPIGFGMAGDGTICENGMCQVNPPDETVTPKQEGVKLEPKKNEERTTPNVVAPGFEIDMATTKWATGDGSQYLRPIKGNANVYAYFDKNDKQLPWLYDKDTGLLASYKTDPSEVYAENKLSLKNASDIYRVESKGDGNYFGKQLKYAAVDGQLETSPFSSPYEETGLNYYYGNMQPIKNGDTTLVSNPGWGFIYQATPSALAGTPYASQLKLGADVTEPVFFNPMQPNAYLQAKQVDVNNFWAQKQQIVQPRTIPQQQGISQQRQQPNSGASPVTQGYMGDWDNFNTTAPAGATILYVKDGGGCTNCNIAKIKNPGLRVEVLSDPDARRMGITTFPGYGN